MNPAHKETFWSLPLQITLLKMHVLANVGAIYS